MRFTGVVLIAGAAFLAACTADSIGAEDTTKTAAAALESDGTIPRVANPPPATDLSALPGDLRAISVPKGQFKALGFVKSEKAAIQLGKALFWDMQVGSDGKTACASCHFRAGADPRSKNQVSPGLKKVPTADTSFTTGGPNHQLTGAEFPLTKLATPGTRGALDAATDSNDAVSSQGVHHLTTDDVDPLGFNKDGAKTRRVEPRNTPSVINAVFNHRQFWDGRAENTFNGVNHVGARDAGARVLRASSRNATPVPVQVAIPNASLASQAVAPILSDLEMSAPGRTTQEVAIALANWSRDMGERVGAVRPLAKQVVDPKDSVLGSLSRAPNPGLATAGYDKMIEEAFRSEWWDSNKLVRVAADGSVEIVDARDDDPATKEYSLLQYNFALIFGIAVQMYEETLVSDDTPWDRFRRENPGASDPDLNPWTNTNPNHISRQALFGAHLFNDRTRGPTNIRCSNCHESAELTDNSVRRVNAATNGPVRNRDGNLIDKGFNNIGLRPTDDDLGAGASDAFGPLSQSKRLFPGAPPATFDGSAISKGFGVEGAFKIPSLRNVALTAPYFHNGDAATLKQAVEFYSRGGNVFPVTQTDGTPIEPLGVPNLTEGEVDAIVAWLESLTDERVLYRRAPFDHPQLFVPNGHPDMSIDADGDGFADDLMVEIGAVGANGGAPIPGFLQPGPFGSN